MRVWWTLSDADRFPWDPALPSATRKDIAAVRALVVGVLGLHRMAAEVTRQPFRLAHRETGERLLRALIGHRRDPTPGSRHRRERSAGPGAAEQALTPKLLAPALCMPMAAGAGRALLHPREGGQAAPAA